MIVIVRERKVQKRLRGGWGIEAPCSPPVETGVIGSDIWLTA